MTLSPALLIECFDNPGHRRLQPYQTCVRLVLTIFSEGRRCRVISVVDGYIDLVGFFRSYFPKMSFSKITKGDLTSKKLMQGGVRGIISAFHCPDSVNGPKHAAKYLSNLITYAQNYLSDLSVLTSSKHLNQVMAGNVPPAIIPLIDNADALLEWDLMDIWFRGFRTIGLTYGGMNRIGDGHAVRNPSGLSSKGRKLVRRLSESGFIIDTTRLSTPSFNQVVRNFHGALIASHAGLRHFCDLPYNLSYDQIQIIVDRGGIIGVALDPEKLSLSRRAGLSEVFAHIDWLVQRYGPDYVALGSDFGAFKEKCDGLESPGELQRLAEMLESYGYPRKAVAKIMGENWAEFYALHLDGGRFYESPPQ